MHVDLNEHRQKLAEWLGKMSFGLEPGRFRFCSTNSFVPVDGRRAQVSTCFALKAAWQAGVWDLWSIGRQRACIDFIKAFQQPDGWFRDKWLDKAARPTVMEYTRHMCRTALGRAVWSELVDRKERNRRAETRQSAATLLMVGEKLDYPLPLECITPEEIRNYISAFDWSQPWSAGSHLSHLIFMLTANWRSFGEPTNYNQLIEIIIDYLDEIKDDETGCWYTGNPDDTMKINGAMKVFSGLQWLDHSYSSCESLLDFALRQPFQTDGCGFLNRLFVIHQARKASERGYRAAEVKMLAEEAMQQVKRFQKPDGAFSFYESGAQTYYYGARVSSGDPVSDLHGTAMLTWAIALCAELLEYSGTPYNGWKVHWA